MVEWQPISTAPKDGTAVLLYQKEVGMDVGKWVLGKYEYWDQVDDTTRKLVVEETGYWRGTELFLPTHWMTLPEPPKENDDD